MSTMLEKYWTEEEVKKLAEAKEYADLTLVAMTILSRMPQPIGQVCGPLTTGGQGSLDKNDDVLQAAIDKLRSEGKNIFNQLPFEKMMQRLRKALEPTRYSMELLKTFYLPLFKSGKISILYFLPDWEGSIGSNWEHNQAKELGLEIVYLPGKPSETEIITTTQTRNPL